ncbi:hypothetical protein LD11_gp275 [Bacillus phage Riley]|uniref:Uncharacterized protein n=3 Tax=Bequatrovirus TaxID=1917990 RepID=A0A075M4W0_9CAUD|nr:hypothetical protein LD11_gp275 [Bacillus phage Riley]YP_009206639.1 hypothetical protein AVV02_gp284 [Bacillus phage AvesoBmore]ASZ76008.1 hypothetical protein TAFFO16_275 [Bacillus phage Taffo16]ULF48901.1 hypothetical protein [Bacillus phage BillyBob]AIF72151.1 hypothetical protein [Bacillus phage Riley]ALA13423.1 hypothetical protein AVESOBMORE_284 [Bacillus phage AvesoBmore]
MNKFADISKIDTWTTDELKKAVKYYEVQLKDPRTDDNERRWLNRAVTKCESLLNPPSEWENLFK